MNRMEREDVKSIVESLLFVADAPQTLQRFAEVLEGVDKETIQAVLTELQAEWETQRRGVQLVEVAGGYQLRTAKGQCRLGQEISRRTTGAHG
jgi:segregation and condensation protein B